MDTVSLLYGLKIGGRPYSTVCCCSITLPRASTVTVSWRNSAWYPAARNPNTAARNPMTMTMTTRVNSAQKRARRPALSVRLKSVTRRIRIRAAVKPTAKNASPSTAVVTCSRSQIEFRAGTRGCTSDGNTEA